ELLGLGALDLPGFLDFRESVDRGGPRGVQAFQARVEIAYLLFVLLQIVQIVEQRLACGVRQWRPGPAPKLPCIVQLHHASLCRRPAPPSAPSTGNRLKSTSSPPLRACDDV